MCGWSRDGLAAATVPSAVEQGSAARLDAEARLGQSCTAIRRRRTKVRQLLDRGLAGDVIGSLGNPDAGCSWYGVPEDSVAERGLARGWMWDSRVGLKMKSGFCLSFGYSKAPVSLTRRCLSHLLFPESFVLRQATTTRCFPQLEGAISSEEV